ncbi:class I SAM-dependent methyltransferase [Phytohabitans sp. ZYX-F-186]|uniref:Class I SAM-dependent methyltransferase n=1 Tax=Phytohabitans maris TaxID=3071409 RepID=A0ABU0ZW10_9ACTN|nr:class I SAM-dependent methyltransferase [Phytohabitans sp. ZYX-F-186]MDQ7910697.1 class I SAM-dependent methyltransferase [Phytohabitans sp. ZYX-F-186]
MPPVAAYDAHADWYEEYVRGKAAPYTRRSGDLLADLLGPGQGTCLDLCCGTGVRAEPLRALGWTPLGADISRGQLRHATARMPVAAADAAALPVATASLPAVVCALAHTDLPDYAAVLREVARVLRPGGRFVHVGVHPCFVGAFADWSDRPRVLVDERYADRSYTTRAWDPSGVRARVGAWHVPLADLLNAVTGAGLRLTRTAESSPAGVADVFGLLALKPA